MLHSLYIILSVNNIKVGEFPCILLLSLLNFPIVCLLAGYFELNNAITRLIYEKKLTP
ncbi:hypothetical protein LguiA_006396 [Lonicera macranthoides]